MARRNYVPKKPPVPIQPVWRGDEPCRKVPSAFHPIQGDTHAARAAKWICGRCPSQQRCLEWAIRDPEQFGILAGTTYRERQRIRAQRSRK